MNEDKAVVVQEQGAVQTQRITGDEVMQYVKAKCPQATEAEATLFIKLCLAQNLNPFLNEAYLIKYGNGAATQVVGKDVFLKRANHIAAYQGFKGGVIVTKNNGIQYRDGSLVLQGEALIGGWAEVYRQGYQVAIRAEVSMSEYGKPHGNWKNMPATMIRKVALVQALRETFPDEYGGLYDAAEMPNVREHEMDNIPTDTKPPMQQPQAKQDAPPPPDDAPVYPDPEPDKGKPTGDKDATADQLRAINGIMAKMGIDKERRAGRAISMLDIEVSDTWELSDLTIPQASALIKKLQATEKEQSNA